MSDRPHPLHHRLLRSALGLSILLEMLVFTGCSSPGGTRLRFEVEVPAAVRSEPMTGRMFVMISRTDQREPRSQVGRTGIPFFGVDVEGLAPGQPVVIDGTVIGSPVERLADLPAGDYFVQAMLNVYTRLERADGHVVWMHQDQWEGQNWRRSPGNLYSEVVQVHQVPERGGAVRLAVPQAVPPVEVPPDEMTDADRQRAEQLEENRKAFEAVAKQAKALSIPVLTRTQFLYFLGYGVPKHVPDDQPAS